MTQPMRGSLVRFNRGHTCPVCGGADDDTRGEGRRCHGYVSKDWIHCTREEHAGQAKFHATSQTWSHKATGNCPCGVEHAPEPYRAPQRNSGKRKLGPIVRVYQYCDLAGKIIHETTRHAPKDFRQRRPDGSGGYVHKEVFAGITPILYKLSELCAADPERIVYIVEGEKDVERLMELGLVATTNPMGALHWYLVDSTPLTGRRCVVIVDNDDKGRKHAQEVAADLVAKGCSVKLLELPDLPEKGDVSDWIDGGGDAEQLDELATAAPDWKPVAGYGPFPAANGKGSAPPPPEIEVGEDVTDPVGEVDPIAFHGPLGRLALETQKQTEANALFVLLHLIAFFGNAVGRGPHFIISASRHYLNLFVGLIGASGFGRKGTAAHVARESWRKIDPTFTDENISDGLNSGAGLLYHLRDPSEKSKNGPGDEGIADKRRVFLESELSSVLMQGHRENDPLLGHLRKFFDGEEVVRSNTKDPTKVTGGHVSVVGHCTPSDLDTHLSDADKANGTANRFLWVFGVRSKLLPEGGDVFDLLDNFLGRDLQKLREALDFAKVAGKIRRSPDVEVRWHTLYREFNKIPPGRIGAFFVRSPTIVLRVASIFALADKTTVINDQHLNAALAIWQHADRSLRWIFRADLDPRAERLLDAITESPDGLTKTQIISDVFKRNLDAESINDLLRRLLAHQAIVADPGDGKAGRPAARYKLKHW